MLGLPVTLATKGRADIPARFLAALFQLQLPYIKNALRARVHFCINLIRERNIEMKKRMSKYEFAEKVAQYVKNALPKELGGAEVRIAEPDLWADGPHTSLLIIRPWNGTTTGFMLDKWYQKYMDGDIAAESAAAAVINNRRLYSMPLDGMDASDLTGGAVIYA